MMQYLYHGMDTPVSYKPEDRSAACAAYNKSQLDRCLAALEQRLDGRAHLLGSDFSLADLANASALGFGLMCGLQLDTYPRTAAWCKRCIDRPARQRAR
jgi:glutathione S-transferase